jgi:hypothetical protein
MSGGGGGGNGMMMAMMMQQQQQAAAAQAAQQAAAQAESSREFDIRNQSDAQAAAVAQQQWSYQQEAQRQAAEQSRQDSQNYQAQQQAAQQAAIQAQTDQQNAMLKYQSDQYDKQQAAQQQAIQQAQAASDAKLGAWNNQRTGLYNSSLQDALSQLAGMGDTDQGDIAAVQGAFGRANAGIGDMQNLSGVFDGLAAKTFANLTSQKQAGYTKTLNQLFPTGFDTTKVADTTDDDILNGIMQSQYDDASQQANRLLSRGTITQEGYDANLKALTNQKAGANSKLTTLGNNELNSERSSINNIINGGRSDIANFQLGQSLDPNNYMNKVNTAYDSWFKGLGDKLKGIAPTDLFDTSGFLNTAGNITGPRNSPFVGTTNALTGQDALSTSDDDKKKSGSNALGAPVTGVF